MTKAPKIRHATFWGGVGIDALVFLYPPEGGGTRTDIHLSAANFAKLQVTLPTAENSGFALTITGEWERATLANALYWIAEQLGVSPNVDIKEPTPTFTCSNPDE